MEKVQAILHYMLWGMPVFVWLIGAGLVGLSEALNRSKWTEAQTIAQGVARFLLAFPGLGFALARFPFLGWALSKLGKVEPAPGAVVPPAALLPLLFVIHGCGYCNQVAHKAEPRCKVQAVAQHCGEPAIAKLVLQILPQVVLALLSQDYGSLLNNLVQTLQQQGVQDALGLVSCAVQQVDGSIIPVSGAALPPAVQAEKEHAQLWLKVK